LLVAVLCALPTSGQHVADELDVPSQAIASLRALRGEEPPTEVAVEDYLFENAEGCVDLCLQLLLQESVPTLVEGKPQRLSIQQETIILAALSRMPRELVRGCADRELTGATEERARVVACRVYGRIGGAYDVDLLFELACEADAEETTAALRAGFRDGLKHLLARPDVAAEVERKWSSSPKALYEPTLLAMGDARDARVLPLLSDLITWSDDWAALAIAQIRLIGASLDESVNRRVADSLADRLDDSDARIRESACIALGELRSEEHIGDLIALLDQSDRVLRNAAHQSLNRISGESLPPNSRVWTVWYDRERNAVDDMLATLTDRALRGPAVPLLELLRESTRLELGRHELTEALTPALDHSNDEVRLTACRVLMQLGSPLANDALLHALGDHEDDVRAAALEALTSITGVEGLESPSEWRDYLDDRNELY
jgi:HEAT repeat protein